MPSTHWGRSLECSAQKGPVAGARGRNRKRQVKLSRRIGSLTHTDSPFTPEQEISLQSLKQCGGAVNKHTAVTSLLWLRHPWERSTSSAHTYLSEDRTPGLFA